MKKYSSYKIDGKTTFTKVDSPVRHITRSKLLDLIEANLSTMIFVPSTTLIPIISGLRKEFSHKLDEELTSKNELELEVNRYLKTTSYGWLKGTINSKIVKLIVKNGYVLCE
jgi:hypothetical protein